NAIIYCGAKPVFADIDPRTFNIDAEQIEDKITKKTSAIIPVPLYGHACDMDPINEIADEHGLRVVEDACQAHGAEYKGRKVGALGDCGVFSFYPTKNMTTGEGGMMTTNEEKIAERARLIRAHGSSKKYHHEILGYNYRMTEISAAIGIEQLRKLDEMNERRIKNADMLTEGISKIEGLTPPYILPDTTHVFHQYTVRVTKEFSSSRDELVAKLNNKGIGAGIYYPIPIHKQELYQKLNYAEDLPEAEKAAGEVLSLPVHPAVSEKDIKFIISSLG
ncbi:MAG: DegT/DnrJ/EryC1/StrS family aminotransferase, partial [Candidatus Hydrothermarchaeaceae archaeon]